MLSKARQKKIMEKLNRAQKCSISGPQNLGSGGGPGPPLDPHLNCTATTDSSTKNCQEFRFPFVNSLWKFMKLSVKLYYIEVSADHTMETVLFCSAQFMTEGRESGPGAIGFYCAGPVQCE